MVRIWRLSTAGDMEIRLSDMSSLDGVTRQLADGYYSTFRTYDSGTRVLGLSAHLKRLPGVDGSHLRRKLDQHLEQYRPAEARVRPLLTFDGQLYIAIEQLLPIPPEVYVNGVHVETTEIQRHDPRVKSTSFIEASRQEREHLAGSSVYEALLVKNGRILEGMTSNFFYVINGIIHTAQRDVLLGVTRRTVIRVARGSGLDVKFSPLKVSQLSAAEEAFITSSSRGIVPVIQINDVTVGEGRPGPITRTLWSAYEDHVKTKAESIL